MFCGECGTKNETCGKFCQECGTKFEVEEVLEPEKSTEVTESVDDVKEKKVYVKKEAMSPKKKKTIIFVLIIGILLIGGYFFGRSLTGPEKIALEYVKALVNGDSDKLFDIYDLEKSEFVTKEKFAEAIDSDEYDDVIYKVVDVTISDDYALVEFELSIGDNGGFSDVFNNLLGNNNFEVRLKLNGKKYFLFDNWVVDLEKEDMLVTDYEIIVMEGSKVKVDDKDLSSYYNRTEESMDIYTIPSALITNYDIEVEYPFGIKIEKEIYFSSYSNEYEVDSISLSDLDIQTRADIEDVTLVELQNFYDSIIFNVPFEDVLKEFTYDGFDEETFEDDYEDFLGLITGTYKLRSIEFKNPELTYVTINNGMLRVNVDIDYNYQISYTNYNDEEQVYDKSRTSVSQSIYLKYVDGEYRLAEIYDITDYFSRY